MKPREPLYLNELTKRTKKKRRAEEGTKGTIGRKEGREMRMR